MSSFSFKTFYLPELFKFFLYVFIIRNLCDEWNFKEWYDSIEFDEFWTLATGPNKTYPNFVFNQNFLIFSTF